MRKVVGLITGILFTIIGFPKAASMLGVSSYAATKAVDAIMMGLSIWSVLGIVAVSGGTMAVVWYGVRSLIKRAGRRAAIAW